MARGFNKVILMGNLTRDPDIRSTPSKQKVANFTIAVSRQWKNKVTGEQQEQTDFIPIVAWGFTADICDRYLRKGNPVLVEGRLQVRTYDDPKTGVKKWVTEVVTDNLTLLSSGRRSDGYEAEAREPRGESRPARSSKSNYDAMDVGSLRDEPGYEEDFPLDFSELQDDDGGPGDVDVPF